MKYTIAVQFNTGTELIFRVKAENSKEAVSKTRSSMDTT